MIKTEEIGKILLQSSVMLYYIYIYIYIYKIYIYYSFILFTVEKWLFESIIIGID